ncbi:MAG: IPT/TIG domain-containing protein [Bacteriovoracia bacterium]
MGNFKTWLCALIFSAVASGCSGNARYVTCFVFISDCPSVEFLSENQERFPTPTIFSVSPAYGTQAGGTELHVYGADFLPDLYVSVGEYACEDVEWIDSGHVRCWTGRSLEAGPVGVTLTNQADIQSAHLDQAFQYFAPLAFPPPAGAVYASDLVALTASGGIPPYTFHLLAGPGVVADDEYEAPISLPSPVGVILQVIDSVGLAKTMEFTLYP